MPIVRSFLGYRAKSMDSRSGECLEYTDPMPTREAAIQHLRDNMTWLTQWPTIDRVYLKVVKVYGQCAHHG